MADYLDDLRNTLGGRGVSRRAFLGGTLGLTAGALLAACGGDDDDGDDAATNTPASAAGDPTATAADAMPEATATASGDTETVRDYSEVTVFENPEAGTPDGSQPEEQQPQDEGQEQCGPARRQRFRHRVRHPTIATLALSTRDQREGRRSDGD